MTEEYDRGVGFGATIMAVVAVALAFAFAAGWTCGVGIDADCAATQEGSAGDA